MFKVARIIDGKVMLLVAEVCCFMVDLMDGTVNKVMSTLSIEEQLLSKEPTPIPTPSGAPSLSPNHVDHQQPGISQVIQIAVNFTSFWVPSPVLQKPFPSVPILINSTSDESPLIQLFECSSSSNCSEYANLTNPLLTNGTGAYAGPASSAAGRNVFDGTSETSDLWQQLRSNSSWEDSWTFNNWENLSSSSPQLPGNVSIITRNWTTEPDLRIHHPFLAIFLGLICLIVMLGNILIMVAIRRERYLHTVTNLFVASLAVADCLVGAIVMPSSVVHEVMNKWWIFGQDWCDLWHSFDVLASTASILNLCVISLDRYWAITDPITYPARMTPRKAKILIALVWTCSAIISFPAILWWRAVSAPPRPLRCDFTEDIGYLVFSSIISFYGPLIIMLFVYYRIYRAAVQQTKSVKAGTKSIQSHNGSENAVVLRIHRGGGAGHIASQVASHVASHERGSGPVTVSGHNCVGHCYTGHGYHPTEANPLTKTRLHGEVSFEDSGEFMSSGENGLDVKVSSVRHRNMKAFSLSRKLAKLAKEKKAAKTLGIVMGVFILCWLPFFIANLVKGICGDTCLINPDLVYPIVTWLGWLNSGMNPVIYACWSKDFRRAFKKILCSCYKPSRGIKNNRPATGQHQSGYSFSTDLNQKLTQKSPKCPDSIGMIGLSTQDSMPDATEVNDIFYLTKK